MFGRKTYLHGPMDYAKKLKLRFRVGWTWTYQKEERDIPVESEGGRRTWLYKHVPVWHNSRE